MIRIF